MNEKFINWCTDATYQVRYKKDREIVYQELMMHLMDRQEALMAQGLAEEEAADRALEAMGSAKEIAPQFAQLHNPFWAYFLRWSRIAAIALLCICMICVGLYVSKLDIEAPDYRGIAVFEAESYGGDSGLQLHHLSQPDVSFSAFDSTFTITDVSVFTDVESQKTKLYVQIRQRSLLPAKEFLAFNVSSITDYFSASDSLGNSYHPYHSYGTNSQPSFVSIRNQGGIFTVQYECWINDFPADAQWVDIILERDGQRHSVRIYLTGGDRT